MSTTYTQPVLPIADPKQFASVKEAVTKSFAADRVADFLKSLDRSKMRIREFEAVLAKGLLGPKTAAEYKNLGDADQGQIREFYLASLERVTPELRQRFFKLYAYY